MKWACAISILRRCNGDGRSEVRYGRVLGEFPRESFAISTKGSRVLRPENPDDLEPYSEDGIPHYVYDFDFSAEGLRASLDSSLERLGLAAVDIFFVHDSDFKGQHTDEELYRGAGGRGRIAGDRHGQGHRHGHERVGAHWADGRAL